MGSDLARTLCDGLVKPVEDSCKYCFDDCSCTSRCDRYCPCSCTVTTHAHEGSDDETVSQGKE